LAYYFPIFTWAVSPFCGVSITKGNFGAKKVSAVALGQVESMPLGEKMRWAIEVKKAVTGRRRSDGGKEQVSIEFSTGRISKSRVLPGSRILKSLQL
jgi:hypothetical protein